MINLHPIRELFCIVSRRRSVMLGDKCWRDQMPVALEMNDCGSYGTVLGWPADVNR